MTHQKQTETLNKLYLMIENIEYGESLIKIALKNKEYSNLKNQNRHNSKNLNKLIIQFQQFLRKVDDDYPLSTHSRIQKYMILRDKIDVVGSR